MDVVNFSLSLDPQWEWPTHIRAQYPDLLQDARDSMRNLMWHQNQKALSDFVIAILDEPRT